MLKITPPGSKSITNRALVLAALVRKTVTIKNAAICEDSTYMIKCLKKLGIRIEQKGETIKIKGCGGKFPKSDRTIKLHTGNAGTTTRFITALATLTDNKVVIDGDSRMRQRPIKELSDALNQLGADTKTTKNCPPVKIQPKIPEGGTVKIRGDLSSQYISALMMIAPHTKKPTKIQIEQKTCSKPYIKLTKTMIKSFDQQPSSYNVESDASGASYFGAYAALNPQKTILLNN
ncbi:3-phosphoshikimate 1-carboxyvinyltransferase, partial [Patescibacteria group bacterium]|nr:3-phosphoshikimate 1-carboxyvinyltransferase [Patescibacteria group bacterium]